MSPTRKQTKRDIQKTPIFAPTAGARSSISPNLCMLIENVVGILKGVNHFSIQRIVFPAGSKMLIFGHWRTE